MSIIPNTEKWGCRQIAAGLAAFGVKHIVTSPGSRNAPLIMAVARHPKLEVHSVIDERSAAFIALGMASVSGKPVAVICTSGTAMLNFGPAIAEAFYRHIPLIAVTADRPTEWIDQDDSQTIRQPGALQNIVKASYNFKGEAVSTEEQWYVNRLINDALLCATSGRKGPVHINISLNAPLATETETTALEAFRKIDILQVPDIIPNETVRELVKHICGKKVLIVAGFNPPSAKLNKAMGILAGMPNVCIIAEGLANLHFKGNKIHNPDATLTNIEKKSEALETNVDDFNPDILISFGGALVSASLKRFLRASKPTEHWHVGINDATIDCFMSLTKRIEIPPEGFFPKLATSLSHLTRAGSNQSKYASTWEKAAASQSDIPSSDNRQWNAVDAVGQILSAIPPGWNLQLSNGMSVRYALSYPLEKFHRVDCNRGVSGIDGSTSTAVGAASVYTKPTLLITGDMSMQYDISALSSNLINKRLRIVVINNGGGGIFNYVKTTAGLPETPRLIHCDLNLPIKALADAYGFYHIQAASFTELKKAIRNMLGCHDRPVILEVITDSHTDAEIMKTKYV